MWDVKTPEEAKAKIKSQKEEFYIQNPKKQEASYFFNWKGHFKNSLKVYTEKQWKKMQGPSGIYNQKTSSKIHI